MILLKETKTQQVYLGDTEILMAYVGDTLVYNKYIILTPDVVTFEATPEGPETINVHSNEISWSIS